MSIGFGGGGEKTEVRDYWGNVLGSVAQELYQQSKPLRNELLSQLLDTLVTGGTNVPIVNQSVENTMRASSEALKSVDERLAQTGLAGTPFGEQIRGEQTLEGNVAAANTRNELLTQIFQMIPSASQGYLQAFTSGLVGATGKNTTTEEKGSGGSMSASYGNCWVAREVFGHDNPFWLLYRAWLLNRAPSIFRTLYLTFGERFASSISNKPRIKSFLRPIMATSVIKDIKRGL